MIQNEKNLNFKSRKFKLIKNYPGSPPLGIIMEGVFDNYGYTGDIVGDDTLTYRSTLHKSIIENQLEFWKELIFFEKSSDGIDLYLEDNVYWVYFYNSKWNINGPFPIKNYSQKTTNYFQGKWFVSKEKALEFIKANNKQYAFTTVDGVKIYKGDHYWYIDLSDKIIKVLSHGTSCLDTKKAFSTKPAAEKHSIENTRLDLSLNEIMTLFESNHSTLYVNLVQKAKEKLGIVD